MFVSAICLEDLHPTGHNSVSCVEPVHRCSIETEGSYEVRTPGAERGVGLRGSDARSLTAAPRGSLGEELARSSTRAPVSMYTAAKGGAHSARPAAPRGRRLPTASSGSGNAAATAGASSPWRTDRGAACIAEDHPSRNIVVSLGMGS